MLLLLGTILIAIGLPLIMAGLACWIIYLVFKRINIWVAAIINAITCKIAYEKGRKKGKEEADTVVVCPLSQEI